MEDVVIYQSRWKNIDKHTVDYGEWYPWETISKSKYYEVLDYIQCGYSYEVRTLGVTSYTKYEG